MKKEHSGGMLTVIGPVQLFMELSSSTPNLAPPTPSQSLTTKSQ